MNLRRGPWSPGVSSPRFLVTVSLAAAVLTLLAGELPRDPFAGLTPGLDVAIDTAASVSALVAGFVLFNRFRDTGDIRDPILVAAFLLLLVANLCLSSIPALLGDSHAGFAVWSSAAGRLSGALALAAAAFWRPRRIQSRVRTTVVWLIAGVVLLATIAVVVGLAGDALPPGVGSRPGPAGIANAYLVSDNLLATAQLLAAVVLASAAIAFERRALSTGDQLLHWVAPGCMLFAFALFDYFLFPYSGWVSLGDLLLACAYALLLIGGLLEVGVFRRAAATAKVEEREAIAKDMHDVLAQDLAFVAGRLRELALKAELEDRRDRDLLSTLSSTAHRALDQSRVAVWSLARPDAPVEAAVEQAAEEVATREGAIVLVEAQAGLKVSHALKHALLCIVREATTNAIRHGDAGHVEVRLFEDDGVRLEVRDNGDGFDAERPGGFGLTTIRQRVRSCGGDAKIISRPGEGTVVEVHVPAQAVSAENDSAPPSGRRPRRARARPRLELTTAA